MPGVYLRQAFRPRREQLLPAARHFRQYRSWNDSTKENLDGRRYIPFTLDCTDSSTRIIGDKIILVLQYFPDLRVLRNDAWRGLRCWPYQVIIVHSAHVGKMCPHCPRDHEREERVNAIFGEIVGKGAQEQATKGASKPEGIWISLTVSKTPRGQVLGRVVVSEKPIATSESNGITQNRPADSETL